MLARNPQTVSLACKVSPTRRTFSSYSIGASTDIDGGAATVVFASCQLAMAGIIEFELGGYGVRVDRDVDTEACRDCDQAPALKRSRQEQEEAPARHLSGPGAPADAQVNSYPKTSGACGGF
ncbi:hypothetical protein [Bradyrhizobium brasilense]|uniref:hypothetical protein n=1 Tax=Bradyrhizobium brasilense TaxID=1419277 RepID=UPI0014578B66|nr:hypothetical protein [Bradyrhizobium brasilense]